MRSERIVRAAISDNRRHVLEFLDACAISDTPVDICDSLRIASRAYGDGRAFERGGVRIRSPGEI